MMALMGARWVNVYKEIPQISGGIEIVHLKSSGASINSIPCHHPISSLPPPSEKGTAKKNLIRTVQFKTGFVSLGTVDILDQVVLCCGGLSFASQELATPPASPHLPSGPCRPPLPPSCNNQKYLQVFSGVPWGGKSSQVEPILKA